LRQVLPLELLAKVIQTLLPQLPQLYAAPSFLFFFKSFN
jgi:hypothetical protein